MGGGRGMLEQSPRSFTSQVLVAYITLPETRPNDVVSMHECYTHFLLMFIKDGKGSFICSINDIKKGRGGGERGGEGAHKAVFFRRRNIQVLRERLPSRTAGRINV